MINATDPKLSQYRVGALRIVEMSSLPHGRSWTPFRDLDVIAIRADLTGPERDQALGAALADLIGMEPATV